MEAGTGPNSCWETQILYTSKCRWALVHYPARNWIFIPWAGVSGRRFAFWQFLFVNVFPTHDVLFDWTWAGFLILNEVTDDEADVSPPAAAQTPALASSINLFCVSYSTPSFPLTVNDENMEKMVKFLYIKFVWWKTNLYEKCDFL